MMFCLLAQAEDVDVDGLPKSASRSKYDLDGGGGQVSLLIRVSHKVSPIATLPHKDCNLALQPPLPCPITVSFVGFHTCHSTPSAAPQALGTPLQ